MRRPIIVVLLTATTAVAAAAPAAQAAPRRATDGLAGLQFTLSGKTLTLKLTGRRQAAKRLRGVRVNVSCASKNASGKPNSPLVARASGTWARRAQKRSFTLSRDVSAKADWCMVQTASAIISNVDLNTGRNPREGGSV